MGEKMDNWENNHYVSQHYCTDCYSKSPIGNFHMKISLGKFILILEFHKWILVCGYEVKEILAHISVQIRWKVLLLSAGNIQAEIFNRLSRSIRQELTKNAVKKK